MQTVEKKPMNPVQMPAMANHIPLRWSYLGILLASLALVCCSCAVMPPGHKMAVMHDELKPVKTPVSGTVVLREMPNQKRITAIGGQQLHGMEWALLLNPAFLTGSLVEIEGRQPLNTVIREDLAEALTAAGYQVIQQAHPKRAVPRAGKNRAIVEFDIKDYSYMYEVKAGNPDEFSVEIHVRLLSPRDQAVLWEKTYYRKEKNDDLRDCYFASEVLTEVLNEMAGDFASEPFTRQIL